MWSARDDPGGDDALRDRLHDLRNLFGAIASGSHLLADPQPAARRDQLLWAIEGAATRGATIVSRLLAQTAPSAGGPCDPAARIAGLAPILTAMAGREVALRLDLSATGVVIDCAGDQLDRTVLELVANARRAIGAHGRIEIRLKHSLGRVWIIVADNGTGIAPRRLMRLLHAAGATGRDGHGFGLRQVRAFVAQADGVLRVRAQPGRGAVFAMVFPAAAPPGIRDIADRAPLTTRLASAQVIRGGDGHEEHSGADA